MSAFFCTTIYLTLVDNIPGSIEQKAKLLNINAATLRKYRKTNQAPRSVHLALFWESVWGISYIESIAGLRTSTFYAQAQAVERQNKRLTEQIAELARSDTGPANLPIFQIG